MIKKFGQKEPSPKKESKKAAVKEESKATEPKKTTRKRKKAGDDDNAEDDDADKKPKKQSKAVATNEKNQDLADAFSELAGFEFKRGEKFKGGTWSKVAKAIRENEDEITSGKEAMKLKGIGKSSAAKMDEFFETGTIQALEEFRAGNM